MSLKSCPRPPFVYLAVKNVFETFPMYLDFFGFVALSLFKAVCNCIWDTYTMIVNARYSRTLETFRVNHSYTSVVKLASELF